MGKLDDFLNKLTGNNKISAHADKLPIEFSKCKKVYKCTLGDPDLDQMPLFVGKLKNNYLLYFGGGDSVLELNKDQFLYLLASLTKVLNEDFQEMGSSLNKEMTDGLDSGKSRPAVGSTVIPENIEEGEEEEKPKKSSGDLKEFLEKVEKAKEILSREEEEGEEDEMSEEYKNAKKEVEDFQEIFDSLSPEEKTELERTIAERSRELLFEKAKVLEKELLGEVESDLAIEYDYAYFKKIYTDKGAEFMREELAKIPKEDRKDIINKIVEEVKKEEDEKNIE